MSDQAFFYDLWWRIGLAEYDEFCKDLEQGLKDLTAAPCSYLQQEAWCYLRLSKEEAKRTFRSRFYIQNPPRAKQEWGEDSFARERAMEWPRLVLRDSNHLTFFDGEIPTRFNIKSASKYLKLRLSKTHGQALKAIYGENCPCIKEAHLRRLAEAHLVSAQTIRNHLIQRAHEFGPLQFKESRFKDTLRYTASIDGLDYKLRFIIDNRERGGLECEIFISRSSEKRQNDVWVHVAKPVWDIITPESLQSGLNYLVRRIRVRLNAALPGDHRPS